MRIVSWNCNGKFREKFKMITELKADIYIIQECENPLISNNNEYLSFSRKHFWCGESKNKGLGVFVNGAINISENNWDKYCLRNFISVKVNEQFDLVGVWACNPYIEEYYMYQNINFSNFNDCTIIMGDFNSNAIWDKQHGNRNHSAVVAELFQKGLVSAYHYVANEMQGEEKMATFYMYRDRNKPYHIDHCFLNPNYIGNYAICSNAEKWLRLSDHIPIVLDIV